MVSLEKIEDEVMELPSCTPKHLLTEEQTIMTVRENAPMTAPMPQSEVKKEAPLAVKAPEAGVLTQICQKEMAQERLDAILRRGAVFALRQDLRFKDNKNDVLIEQGARIKIHCAELTGNGKKVKLDLYSVTKDDWNDADLDFGKHKFRYTNLIFNIDTLEKYFQPDFEVTRLMNCATVFKYLSGVGIFFSALLGLLVFLMCLVGYKVEHATMFAVVSSICGIVGGLTVLFGMLSIRTRNIIYGELRNVENEILHRTLGQRDVVVSIPESKS